MGDPALERTNSPLAIEGLEFLFEPEPVTKDVAPEPERVARLEEPVTGITEAVPTSGEPIPVEAAAKALGTSVNALKKRLRKGTLRGSKLDTKHGEKWFIDANSLKEQQAPVAELTASDAAPVPKSKASDAAPVTGAKEPITHAAAEEIKTERPGISELLAKIKELEHKLEGATFRTGYLEAENEGLRAVMEAQSGHIKLLTDSQHRSQLKRGWSRFWSWFTGVN